ncbi:MAG: hypothetical protein OXI64_12655 [Defluviicoccus sp.]|nr:hypothetical protein [Defluviicoccus sp.]
MDGDPGRKSAPHLYNYTREGFAGARTNVPRAGYSPAYTRIAGEYAPRRFDIGGLFPMEGRPLPVAILQGEGIVLEAARYAAAMDFAMRNVVADEVHYIVAGGARLETDFGALDVAHGDFVLVPRAVAWRYAGIGEPVQALIAACEAALAIDPDPPGVLNTTLDVDEPVPFGDAVPGAYEVVVRHRGGTTSYFYEFDPLGGEAARGAPQVRRFNIESAKGLGVASGGIPPGRLIDDATGRSLFYHLGSRRSDRPPIHCNADYDEIIVYASGPGAYGGMTVPGTVAWTPKGIAHHGAEEDVAEPYQAWLLETRANLSMTEAGRSVARLMETGEYGIHPADG